MRREEKIYNERRAEEKRGGQEGCVYRALQRHGGGGRV